MGTFHYNRTIHFADTDAAGVVFFARYLSIAHEAYEEALGAAGIPLGEFFKDNGIVIPVAKSEVSYLRPLIAGDAIRVDVTPTRTSDHGFTLDFVLWKVGPPEKRAAVMRTGHVCINSANRAKTPLPADLVSWIEN